MIRAAWNRCRDLLRRDALAHDVDEELAFHRRMLERDAVHEGESPDDAGRRAARRLGNRTRLNEELRAMWGFAWMDEMGRNLRYLARGVARSPGFTLTVVVTLALGIGANAAMFGIVDRLMLRPYPFMRNPASVGRVYIQYDQRGTRRTDNTFEYTRYLDFKRWAPSLENTAAIATRQIAIGTGETVRERPVAIVSGTFWDFFDVRPAVGRFFTPDEDVLPRGAEVVVLGYDFWQTVYGGRSEVIGEVVQVGNVPSVVIGVAPRGFVGVRDGRAADAYVPITTYAGSMTQPRLRDQYYLTYNWGWMEMMVRRKPDVTAAAASAELSVAYARSWEAERALSGGLVPASVAHPSAIVGALKVSAGPMAGLEARTALWVTGVAFIVLLIACANVANLFLARAFARRREIAIRLALGVSRRRLVGQFVTESVGLALAGCTAGLVAAQWTGTAMRAVFTPDAPTLDVLGDWRTIAVAGLVAIVAGALIGLAPLFVAVRGDLAPTLKAGAREGTFQRSRTRSTLLVAQGALSVVLLVGAGLFLRSLTNVRELRLGYDPERLLLAAPTARGYTPTQAERVSAGRRLLAAAQAMPEVESAAWVNAVPFWSTESMGLFVPGVDSVRRLGQFTFTAASPDYFRTMGTRIVQGRAFDANDRAGTPPVLVVSEGMARALWPGEDALGKCVRFNADTTPCATVVGVSEDVVERDLTGLDHFGYFIPSEQFDPGGGFVLVARTRGDPAAAAEPIRRRLQREVTGQTYVSVDLLSTVVGGETRSWEAGAKMFTAFGLLALIVAAVGMYGVIAYNVAQRSHELGVRVALGADRGDIVRLVVSQGLRLAAAGIAIGSVAALAAGRLIEPLLFRQSSTDPAVFAGVAAVLIVVSLAASALPAARATRADPNQALRAD